MALFHYEIFEKQEFRREKRIFPLYYFAWVHCGGHQQVVEQTRGYRTVSLYFEFCHGIN